MSKIFSNTKRLFIAVPLPTHVQTELQRIIRLLKQQKGCTGTYANLHDVHVTVQLLDQCPKAP